MNDEDFVLFLQWALPQMRLRWQGFRKVRRQVKRRVARRIVFLGLENLDQYRAYLTSKKQEWAVLDRCCRITISRFYRDRAVFDYMAKALIPALVYQRLISGKKVLRCWSAGCASGEEPYTLAIIWSRIFAGQKPPLELRILATDADSSMIDRARKGIYESSSLRELSPQIRDASFESRQSCWQIKRAFRGDLTFVLEDIRKGAVDGSFHLILCRNLAFTYFDEEARKTAMERLLSNLSNNGALVIGKHESLPLPCHDLVAVAPHLGIYERN